MKEAIRTNLQMLDDNLANFNDYTRQFIDLKETRKMISAWRWYVSHDSFSEKQPKPVFPASNPPITWLNSQLQGKSTPLSKDIGICIQPVVHSGLEMKHAAKRIWGRLIMLLAYVSKEDAKKDQAAQHKINVTDPAQRKAATEYELQRRHKAEAKAREKTPEQIEKIVQKAKKKRDQQRTDERKRREIAKKEAKKRGLTARKKMEQDLKQRRKDEFGVQA